MHYQMVMATRKDLFFCMVVVTSATFGGILTILLQGQIAEAQQMSGPITAAEGGEPYGGQEVGTVSIDSTGRRTNISADINDMPGEGNIFEGWLVDTGGSGYKLSLGQFRNGTLDFSQYMVNPYTYNNFEVTEEPAEDPDPNAADSIAGFQLQDPFGK
jgi:hypothetical protein